MQLCRAYMDQGGLEDKKQADCVFRVGTGWVELSREAPETAELPHTLNCACQLPMAGFYGLSSAFHIHLSTDLQQSSGRNTPI